MDLKIRYLSVGKWRENSYILEYKGQSVLIDPGDDFEKLDKKFQENNTKHLCILNTHGHFDHIGAVEDFKSKYNIPFYLHSKDKKILYQANMIKRFTGDKDFIKIPSIDHFLDTLTAFEMDDKKIVFHHTPGHSPGSVCMEIENNLFSGDILFNDSIGRIDLPGGSKDLLNVSLNFIIERFKGYHIFPGHSSPFILNEDVIKRIQKLI